MTVIDPRESGCQDEEKTVVQCCKKQTKSENRSIEIVFLNVPGKYDMTVIVDKIPKMTVIALLSGPY